MGTVLCISVGPRPHGLETRLIIKISAHPCYPRNFDCFSCDEAKKKLEKKNPKWPTKKMSFSKPSILNIFSLKFQGLVLWLGG
jgi:hypothetical protein